MTPLWLRLIRLTLHYCRCHVGWNIVENMSSRRRHCCAGASKKHYQHHRCHHHRSRCLMKNKPKITEYDAAAASVVFDACTGAGAAIYLFIAFFDPYINPDETSRHTKCTFVSNELSGDNFSEIWALLWFTIISWGQASYKLLRIFLNKSTLVL